MCWTYCKGVICIIKMQLKYIGNNQPQDMIIECEEKDAQRLLNSGNYEIVGDSRKKETTIKSNKVKKPDKHWTEMEIYNWIGDNNIPVKYKPVNDTKAEVLEKLKEGGYI